LAKNRESKSKGTELDVFQDRAARANTAIFDILAKDSPQNLKQLLKKITKYDGLEETYYASLTKRLHRLQEAGFVRETKQEQKGTKVQANYELRMKAYLAMVLKENSIQEIIDRATDTQAAHILLALLNVLLTEKDRDEL